MLRMHAHKYQLTYTCLQILIHIDIPKRERDRQTDRQTDGRMDRHTDTQIHRHTDIEGPTERYRKRERESGRTRE